MKTSNISLLIALIAFAILVVIGIMQSPPSVELKSKIENNYDRYSLPALMSKDASHKIFFDGKEVTKYQSFQARPGVIGLSTKDHEKPVYEIYVEANEKPVEIGESGIFVSLQKTSVFSEFLFFKEGSKMFEISMGLLLTIIVVSFIVSVIVRRFTRQTLFSWIKGKITGVKKDWNDA